MKIFQASYAKAGDSLEILTNGTLKVSGFQVTKRPFKHMGIDWCLNSVVEFCWEVSNSDGTQKGFYII